MNEELMTTAVELAPVATEVVEVVEKTSGLTKFFKSVPGKATGIVLAVTAVVGGTLFVEHKVVPAVKSKISKPKKDQDKNTAEETKKEFEEGSEDTED